MSDCLLQELSKTLAGQSGSLQAVKCDVTKETDIESLFSHIRADPALGKVHVIVNSAGIGHEAPLLSGQTQQWRSMLDVRRHYLHVM